MNQQFSGLLMQLKHVSQFQSEHTLASVKFSVNRVTSSESTVNVNNPQNVCTETVEMLRSVWD